MTIIHHVDFLTAILIIIVAIVLSIIVYQGFIRLNFFVLDLRFSHWLSIIGTIGIAIATPLFTIFKHAYPVNWQRIVRFHIFGNLIFFTLIVAHFVAQVARPAEFFPELGSGLAMFTAMSIEIFFGFSQRFRSRRRMYNKVFDPKTNKFVHASLVMVFYIVIIFHVLHGFGVI